MSHQRRKVRQKSISKANFARSLTIRSENSVIPGRSEAFFLLNSEQQYLHTSPGISLDPNYSCNTMVALGSGNSVFLWAKYIGIANMEIRNNSY